MSVEKPLREDYFRERLSQWSGKEPPIPMAVFVTYERRPRTPGVDSPLTKAEVVALIREAGVSLAWIEKWRQVRCQLMRRADLQANDE